MFYLTGREKKVLLAIAALILLGGVLRYFSVAAKIPYAVADKPKIQSTPVNVNTAVVQELQALPGIGPSTAMLIVQYRVEHGAFKTTQDLRNVKGLGEKKLQALQGKIIF